jgi:pimeloyl-ACP methyl ester carboxylesterase
MGHSFGGKVALAYAGRAGVELEQVWVLDSNPGASGPDIGAEVSRALTRLGEAPGPFESREAATRALQARGVRRGTARWLASNYERRNGSYVLKLDVRALEDLLSDYFEKDYWPFLADGQVPPVVHLVIAEESDRSRPELRRRAASLEPPTRTRTHVLPNAGHWLHVDNPAGLVELVLAHF